MKSLKYFIFFLFMHPSHKISSDQNAPDTRSRCIRLTLSYSSKHFHIVNGTFAFLLFTFRVRDCDTVCQSSSDSFSSLRVPRPLSYAF